MCTNVSFAIKANDLFLLTLPYWTLSLTDNCVEMTMYFMVEITLICLQYYLYINKNEEVKITAAIVVKIYLGIPRNPKIKWKISSFPDFS